MKKIIIILAIVFTAYFCIKRQPQQAEVAQTDYSNDVVKYFEQEDDPQKIAEYIIKENTSRNGFRPLPEAYSKHDGVLVYAPNGCPKNQQLETAHLIDQLKAHNIPVTRTNSFHTNATFKKRPTDKELAVMEKQMQIVVKNQPSPLVFINGKAKSAPSVADVIDEYNAR